MPKLYCPKCGNLMTEAPDGHLECAPGRMPLSPDLEQRLLDCYVTMIRRPRELIFTYGDRSHAIGGNWFCPGCCVPAQETSPGDLRCPACSRSLVEFIHSLIELHPHLDGTNRKKEWKRET